MAMNKLIMDQEERELAQLLEGENEDNLVRKVLNDEGDKRIIQDENIEDYNPNISLVPLTQIRPRKYNGMILSNIDELAESIKKIGLLEPIIIFPEKDNDGKIYSISGGHRRYLAYQKNYEDAFNNNQLDEADKYAKIPARILTKSEAKIEEDIYKASNTYRDITIFERILAYDPTVGLFDDLQKKKEYLDLKADNGYERYKHGEIKCRFSYNDVLSYYAKVYLRSNPDTDYSERTIMNYVDTVLKASPEVIDAVLNAKISPRQSREIVTVDKELQPAVLKAFIEGDGKAQLKDIIAKLKTSDKIDIEDDADKKVLPEKRIQSIGNTLIKQLAGEQELEEMLKQKPKLTGNQKEYVKAIKKVYKMIKDLKEMPL